MNRCPETSGIRNNWVCESPGGGLRMHVCRCIALDVMTDVFTVWYSSGARQCVWPLKLKQALRVDDYFRFVSLIKSFRKAFTLKKTSVIGFCVLFRKCFEYRKEYFIISLPRLASLMLIKNLQIGVFNRQCFLNACLGQEAMMFITERWKARLMSEKPFGEISFGCVKYAIIVHSFTCTCTLMR